MISQLPTPTGIEQALRMDTNDRKQSGAFKSMKQKSNFNTQPKKETSKPSKEYFTATQSQPK
jgi:hypothetical protein